MISHFGETLDGGVLKLTYFHFTNFPQSAIGKVKWTLCMRWIFGTLQWQGGSHYLLIVTLCTPPLLFL